MTAVPLQERLNPAQQRIIDELGSTDRPTFADNLAEVLRSELVAALDPLVRERDDQVFVSKRVLNLIHGCELRHVAENDADFEWSVPAARGTVAHKAIELLVAWRGEPTALDLVDDAFARLENGDRNIAEFLQQLDRADRAELAGQVNGFVNTFLETFPPLKRQWAPVAESRSRAFLCDDRVRLQGMVDLTLGRARGNEAGKVLIDLKTGAPHGEHVHDLRFYALVETLKLGVPPRLLVNYYLEAGEPRSEAVTEDLLFSTLQRVVDAVLKLVELADGREPALSPGSSCRFCPLEHTCESSVTLMTDEERAERGL